MPHSWDISNDAINQENEAQAHKKHECAPFGYAYYDGKTINRWFMPSRFHQRPRKIIIFACLRRKLVGTDEVIRLSLIVGGESVAAHPNISEDGCVSVSSNQADLQMFGHFNKDCLYQELADRIHNSYDQNPELLGIPVDVSHADQEKALYAGFARPLNRHQNYSEHYDQSEYGYHHSHDQETIYSVLTPCEHALKEVHQVHSSHWENPDIHYGTYHDSAFDKCATHVVRLRAILLLPRFLNKTEL